MREIQLAVKISSPNGRMSTVLKSQADIHSLAYLKPQERSYLAAIFKAAVDAYPAFSLRSSSSSVVNFGRISS